MNRNDAILQGSWPSPASATSGVRVCIVTSELEGPFLNGGIGSTNRGLALALRKLGYAVDVLYTQVVEGGVICLRGTFGGHVADYARHGIRLRAIFNCAPAGDWPARSYLAMQHLIKERYDAVFFDDLFGTGYYALLARRTGAPQLSGTLMVVTTHGALEWVSEQEQFAILNFDGLRLFEMERRSVELADVVKAPSGYILSKYAGYGWSVPADPVVMPNFVSEPRQRPVSRCTSRVRIDEIVFFGRLETRKGIWLFLRAIDRIKYKLVGRSVTFLGKSSSTGAVILRHSLSWPFKTNLFTNFDQQQAVTYLKGPGRLAVMPSPEDNSPSTVLECLDEGIPFLTSAGSGGQELIDPACHDDTLFEPTVDHLARKILKAVEAGGSIARHSFNDNDLLSDFGVWFGGALRSRQRPAATPLALPGPLAVIALAPGGQPMERTAALLERAAETLEPGTIVHVLCKDPEPLRARLSASGLRVSNLGSLPDVAASLTDQRPSVVALCPVGRIPDQAWFDRAVQCFDGDICAVTGMAQSLDEPTTVPDDPWFSTAQGPMPATSLIGYAPVLLNMLQSTNSGFALLRSDVLGALGTLDVADPRSGQLCPPSVIVHALMVTVHASGRRFEMIPDLFAPPLSEDPLLDRASAGQALELADRQLGAAGADLWSVSRLAVDAGIDRIRTVEGQSYRDVLSHRAGFPIEAVTPATHRDRQITDLARMANAAGHSDLAVKLLADLLPGHGPIKPSQLSDFVNAEAAAIDLLDLYRAGRIAEVNLMHSYSIANVSDSEIQLHANAQSEARAAIAFPEVDLALLDAFSARISLPNGAARPVRLRIDIIADGRSGHVSAERILQPGQGETMLIALPPNLRTLCRVVLGVEMADPLAPNAHAYVRIAKPQFQRFERGGATG